MLDVMICFSLFCFFVFLFCFFFYHHTSTNPFFLGGCVCVGGGLGGVQLFVESLFDEVITRVD